MDYFHDLEKDKFQTLSSDNFTDTNISNSDPKTFQPLIGNVILPLTLATLTHSYFTFPLVRTFLNTPPPDYVKVLLFSAFYETCLFVLNILSVATVTFSVSCIYASRPVSFSTAVSVIPRVLKGLMVTFLLYYLSMFVCEVAFYYFLLQFTRHPLSLMILLSFVIMPVMSLSVYLMTLWQLASVVSVIEPTLYGFTALKKSYELLKGRTMTALGIAFSYQVRRLLYTFVFYLFTAGGADYVYHLLPSVVSWPLRIVIGIFVVLLLMFLNLDWLVAETMFYYSCKSYHNQEMDKTSLYHHLGGYLGDDQEQEDECEPLLNKENVTCSSSSSGGTKTSRLDPVIEQQPEEVIEIKIITNDNVETGVETRSRIEV